MFHGSRQRAPWNWQGAALRRLFEGKRFSSECFKLELWESTAKIYMIFFRFYRVETHPRDEMLGYT